MRKPVGYERYLGEFGECLFDKESGECVGWGFEIVEEMGKELFERLREQYHLECLYPTWYLLTKILGRKLAIKAYGAESSVERGPRKGWKSAVFGTTKFTSKFVSPEWHERVAKANAAGKGLAT